MMSVLNVWKTACLIALVEHSQLVAQICAGTVFASATVRLVLFWINGSSVATSSVILPYTMTSFFLLGMILLTATNPYWTNKLFIREDRENVWAAENIKFGLSILLLSLALIEGIEMLSGKEPPFRTVFNLSPSPMDVVLFFLLSVCGMSEYNSRWRYLLAGVTIIIALLGLSGYLEVGLFTGMASLVAVLFILSGLSYIAMTYHWRKEY